MVSLEEMRKAEAEVQVAAEMKHEAIEKREIETKAEAPIPLRNASLLAFSTKPNGLRAMRMAARANPSRGTTQRRVNAKNENDANGETPEDRRLEQDAWGQARETLARLAFGELRTPRPPPPPTHSPRT